MIDEDQNKCLKRKRIQNKNIESKIISSTRINDMIDDPIETQNTHQFNQDTFRTNTNTTTNIKTELSVKDFNKVKVKNQEILKTE